MEIAGYIAALFIGILLGLIGGGGSIITLPVLIYLFDVPVLEATTYSLFIVGITSLAGVTQYHFKKQVDYKAGILFSIPSLIAVVAVRKWLLPAIPATIGTIGNITLSKENLILALFTGILIYAGYNMLTRKCENCDKGIDEHKDTKINYTKIISEGLFVGGLTGIVGAGGGFLIIPTLVLEGKLPMRIAIGTSLMIITLKSASGFLADLSTIQIRWEFLLMVSAITVTGIIGGNRLNGMFSENKLKTGFGWFTILMGIIIPIVQFYKTN